MKRSNIIGLIGALLGIAVIVSIISWFLMGGEGTILQGTAEATSYKASSKVPGRIEEMHVRQGQKVKKGDLLYVLSTPELEAMLRQAQGAETAAAAQEQKAMTGARSEEIAGARGLWMQAEAGLELAKKTYDRAKSLYEQGVIPAQTFDEADANYKAMQATAMAAQSQYDMALTGAREEDKRAAKGLVMQAAGAVAEVESMKADAAVYAPADGEVSSIIAEQGELVGQGYPVVTLIDTGDMWVTYNVKETLMPRIEVGKHVTAYVPALDRSIEFIIDYVAVEADFATWSATRTQGGFDIRTFSVKTRPVSGAEGLRPGMSALIDWDKL